jgi:hypothetical protein
MTEDTKTKETKVEENIEKKNKVGRPHLSDEDKKEQKHIITQINELCEKLTKYNKKKVINNLIDCI